MSESGADGGCRHLPNAYFSEEEVDQEVNGRVQGDHEVRHVLQEQDDPRPVVVVQTVVALDGFVYCGEEFPAVAEDEQPHDEDGDPGQSLLLGPLVAAGAGLATGHGQGDAPALGRVSTAASIRPC